MKKLTLFLILILYVSLIYGCSAENNNANDNIETKPIENNGEIETTTEDESVLLYADVPTDDFGGYNFRVLNNQSNFAFTIFDTEELNGEVLNDAIYNRNRKVEENLNIKITEISETYSNITAFIKKAVNAGDDSYDIFFNEAYLVAPLALSNMLVDINEVPNLNLSKPWWDKGSVSAYTIKNKLYFINGELHLMNQESVLPVMFNKDIVQQYALDNIYDLVRVS